MLQSFQVVSGTDPRIFTKWGVGDQLYIYCSVFFTRLGTRPVPYNWEKMSREIGQIGNKMTRENGQIGNKISRENDQIGNKMSRENDQIGNEMSRERQQIGKNKI